MASMVEWEASRGVCGGKGRVLGRRDTQIQDGGAGNRPQLEIGT